VDLLGHGSASLGAFAGNPQRALDQHAHQVAAIAASVKLAGAAWSVSFNAAPFDQGNRWYYL